MKNAIVIGANGYIGSEVVKKLLSKGIQVLAISRQEDDVFIKKFEINDNLNHLKLDLREIHLLPNKLQSKRWLVGDDCVFYNFSWEGDERLMDGNIEKQLENVNLLSKSILIASELKCVKFIDSGSIEETFAERYLMESWGKVEFNNRSSNYAISKITARDFCNLLGYLYKIDYVHTRFSATVDKTLSGTGYITTCFRNILNNNRLDEKPVNENLFDIIDLDDLTEAYYFLGKFGKNKVDYFIGSGFPQKLSDYFETFFAWKNLKKTFSKKEYKDSFLFNQVLLHRDTGLDLSNSFVNLLDKIYQ